MPNAPISFPRVYSTSQPWVQQRNAASDGASTFVAGQFVKLTSANPPILAPYVADDTGIFGLVLDNSHAATDEAYSAPFGELHNVVDPRGVLFLMNLTDGSGTVGSGTTRQQDAVIGQLYSGVYIASPYGNVLGIDLSDNSSGGIVAKTIFKIEALYGVNIDPLGDAAGDFNGRVLVSIVPNGIQ